MNLDDKKALNEFLIGAAVVIGITIVFVSIIFASGMISTKETKNAPSSAKVVDTYKECDIIQWHYSPLAEYKYFLHCPK